MEPDEKPTASEDSSAERGRLQVMAVAVSVIGAMLLPAVLGATPFATLLVQLVVFGLLFVQLFRGRAWARWILVALIGVTASVHAAAAAGMMGAGYPRGPAIGFAVIFGWSALMLAVSRPITRFVRTQRARHP